MILEKPNDTLAGCNESPGEPAAELSLQLLEGVWSIEIGDGVSYLPGGVLVLDNGQVRGGDSGYFYFGSYGTVGSDITLDLQVSHYRAQRPAVWGEDGDSFVLVVRGAIANGGTLIEGGTERQDPRQRRVVRMRKRARLR